TWCRGHRGVMIPADGGAGVIEGPWSRGYKVDYPSILKGSKKPFNISYMASLESKGPRDSCYHGGRTTEEADRPWCRYPMTPGVRWSPTDLALRGHLEI